VKKERQAVWATWRWTSGKASNGTIGTCMSNLPKEIPLRTGTFSLDDLVAVFPAKILTTLIRRDPECRRQFAAAIAAHRAEITALMDAGFLAGVGLHD
jgi:hypothetical protein